jgi:hypothetical protein
MENKIPDINIDKATDKEIWEAISTIPVKEFGSMYELLPPSQKLRINLLIGKKYPKLFNYK